MSLELTRNQYFIILNVKNESNSNFVGPLCLVFVNCFFGCFHNFVFCCHSNFVSGHRNAQLKPIEQTLKLKDNFKMMY